MNLAKALLSAKADVNQTDDEGYTPLILATYNDNFKVAQLLLKHGANTDQRPLRRDSFDGCFLQG
ncbi:ankyrin repeat domain-containing protein [Tunturiibacter psychrotolerans]|uniref:ankyrin repeat domain-containing protein n=1 Tax=Tunturiibacter psychrotolerans TaxID=3069686 RepID=UPI00333F97FA